MQENSALKEHSCQLISVRLKKDAASASHGEWINSIRPTHLCNNELITMEHRAMQIGWQQATTQSEDATVICQRPLLLHSLLGR